jgi:hypothetical protein
MADFTCAVLGCSHTSLENAQHVHGMCSVWDCDAPVQGWCQGCKLKVCAPLHGRVLPDGSFTCQHCYWREKGLHP